MHANEVVLEAVEAWQVLAVAILNIVFTLWLWTIVPAVAALRFFLQVSFGSCHDKTVNFSLFVRQIKMQIINQLGVIKRLLLPFDLDDATFPSGN